MPQLKIDNDLKVRITSDATILCTEPVLLKLLGAVHAGMWITELHWDRNGPPANWFAFVCKSRDNRVWTEGVFIAGGDVSLTINVPAQWRLAETQWVESIRTLLVELTIRFGMTSLDIRWS